jgi:hypothetical protein
MYPDSGPGPTLDQTCLSWPPVSATQVFLPYVRKNSRTPFLQVDKTILKPKKRNFLGVEGEGDRNFMTIHGTQSPNL